MTGNHAGILDMAGLLDKLRDYTEAVFCDMQPTRNKHD